MNGSAVALLAVLPGVASPRARKYARLVASQAPAPAGMGAAAPLVLAPLVPHIPSWSPDAGATPLPTALPPPGTDQGTGIPSWSPDLVRPVTAAPQPIEIGGQVSGQQPQGQAPAPAPAGVAGWTTGKKLAVGGGLLALLALLALWKRSARQAPAAAPIIVVSGPKAEAPAPAAPAGAVKANRLKRGGKRWSGR